MVDGDTIMSDVPLFDELELRLDSLYNSAFKANSATVDHLRFLICRLLQRRLEDAKGVIEVQAAEVWIDIALMMPTILFPKSKEAAALARNTFNARQTKETEIAWLKRETAEVVKAIQSLSVRKLEQLTFDLMSNLPIKDILTKYVGNRSHYVASESQKRPKYVPATDNQDLE